MVMKMAIGTMQMFLPSMKDFVLKQNDYFKSHVWNNIISENMGKYPELIDQPEERLSLTSDEVKEMMIKMARS